MLLLAALVAVSAFGWLIKLAPQIIVIGLEVLMYSYMMAEREGQSPFSLV